MPYLRELLGKSMFVVSECVPKYDEEPRASVFPDDNGRKSFANERLKDACSFEININSLEEDREFKNMFSSLFRKPAKST